MVMQGIVKPKRLDFDKKTKTGNYAKFRAGPFERGYGVTVGNSLRRMLLSSLQGALERAFGSKLCFGALIAFAVATTPFAFAGITSAFWALVIGILASLLAEKQDILAYWREEEVRVG